MINEIVHKARKLKDSADYCSYVPDYMWAKPCCKQHDMDYENQIGKLKADLDFLKCTMENASHYTTWYKRLTARAGAISYYLGVTVGGWRRYYLAGKDK